jgi:hypothetical protein
MSDDFVEDVSRREVQEGRTLIGVVADGFGRLDPAI